jgi:DNA-binding transcriptional MerR regulator
LDLGGIEHLSKTDAEIDISIEEVVKICHIIAHFRHIFAISFFVSLPSLHVDIWRKDVIPNRCVRTAAWFIARFADQPDNEIMKPQQLASLLHIAPVTLRQWARETFREFLSPSAQGIHGAHRSFSEHDARILAWIALLKAQNTPTPDIIATLRSAQANNWRNLPPLPGGIANDEPIIMMPVEVAETRIRALQERYEAQLQAIAAERDALKAQLAALQTRLDTATDEIKSLQARLTALAVQEAEMRGVMAQYTVGGRRLPAIVLVAVAALVVVLTMLVLFLLLR